VYSKVCGLTRAVALFATLTLALAVLFRFPADYRLTVCIIISLAAILFVAHCLMTGRFLWALPFLALLGIFTPFHVSRLSAGFISVFDMASMALFAATPMILRRSTMTIAPSRRF
jgi:hypothetical protein